MGLSNVAETVTLQSCSEYWRRRHSKLCWSAVLLWRDAFWLHAI